MMDLCSLLPMSAVGCILSTQANKVLGTSSPLLLPLLLVSLLPLLPMLSVFMLSMSVSSVDAVDGDDDDDCVCDDGGSGGRGWA